MRNANIKVSYYAEAIVSEHGGAKERVKRKVCESKKDAIAWGKKKTKEIASGFKKPCKAIFVEKQYRDEEGEVLTFKEAYQSRSGDLDPEKYNPSKTVLKTHPNVK